MEAIKSILRAFVKAKFYFLAAMLSFQFVKHVAVAFLIAIYPTYYWVTQWLSGFAYRMELGPQPFILAGVIAIGVALITVSYQALKVARTNPVQVLRNE